MLRAVTSALSRATAAASANSRFAASANATRLMSTTAGLDSIGSHRFDDRAMRQHLHPDVYGRFIKSTREGTDLSKEDKNAIASAMHDFATSLGAVNFAHWFTPIRNTSMQLGGANAYKTDSFVDLDYGSTLDLKPIVTGFDGTKLFLGETDGSSFPNGGLRATHTAAAFMSWDRGSPPFVFEDTLYIPAVFVSHLGDALDEKTPLLRSEDAVNEQGVRLLRHLGDEDATRVVSNVGWEQEFFVLDRDTFNARPDLVAVGRTLIGAQPPRGQDTCLNYFGPMSPRVKAFFQDSQAELWRLGLSLNVQHNEVAPAQHECSPIFALTNVATDQNVSCQDIMHKVATDHGLVVLWHEKPFAGINGSGKHNNWGLNTDTGKNLFVPGKNTEAQQSFMAFTSALAYALHTHGDTVRVGVATAGNDHRLGAQEAPPAIMSLYTGVRMEQHIRKIVGGGALEGYGADSAHVSARATNAVPIPTNVEDRNRTAPFPFCGNRWEFRAVGSSQNIAFPLTMVNAAMADGMSVLSERIEGGASVRDAVASMFEESMPVVFNGNGYSDEWQVEAARRGLPNLRNTVDAVETFNSAKNKTLFSSTGIFTEQEVDARQEILFEAYHLALQMEGNTLVRMLEQGVIPAAAKDLRSYDGTSLAGNRASVYADVSEATAALRAVMDSLSKQEDAGADEHTLARFCEQSVKPAMAEAREAADAAEELIATEHYPYPNYQEALYSHMSQPVM